MKLDRKLFKSVVDALRGEGRRGDQRACPRVGLTAEVLIKPLGSNENQQMVVVRVRDLSRTGIGFLHTMSMHEGMEMLLHLPIPGFQPQVILCEVRHCRAVGEKLFAVGASLRKPEFFGTPGRKLR